METTDKADKIYDLLKQLEGNDNLREAYEAAHGSLAIKNLAARLDLMTKAQRIDEMTDAQYAKVRRQALESVAEETKANAFAKRLL
jgi:hypothetical protein